MLAELIAHEVPVEPNPPAPPPPPMPSPEGDPPPAAPPVTEPGGTPPVSDPPPGLLNLHTGAGVAAGTSTDMDSGASNSGNSGNAGGVGLKLGRIHARRLREVYRSAGWPCCDAIEVDLLAAGLLERVRSAHGHETLRVTDGGIAHIATSLVVNRSALSAHEALVEKVAREMTRNGRIAWRGLSLRAQLPPTEEGGKVRWCIARPDVFSIRNTSVEAYAHPVVHEVKVSRADLLGDLRKSDKRAAYLDLGGECWYVLGNDARGRCIGSPGDVPDGCGVMVLEQDRLVVARAAVHRPVQRIPFGVWLALAKAHPVCGFDDDAQDLLAA